MSSNEWKKLSLEECVGFYNGKTRPKEPGDIPVFGGNGIIDYSNSYNSDKEKIIIGRVGAYCGNLNHHIGKCWISDNAISVKPKIGYSGKFLYYLLLTKNLNGMSIGSSQPLLTQQILKKISLTCPSLNEQKAIAHILSTLDDKIEVNNRINKTLEEMAQVIFKHWFVDFEFPNEDGEPYKSSGGEMIHSELGPIPKGWEVSNLEELINISSGKRPQQRVSEASPEYWIPLVGASSIMGYTNEFNFNEPILGVCFSDIKQYRLFST
jgi:type I restriction enzyme S subunit